MKNSEHPVWDVYDQYRTARLNVKYYQVQLNSLKGWNSTIEIILAISASSSIAGLWFWEGFYGGYLWKIIGSIAAVLAVLKPILKLPDKISRKEEILIGYKALHHDLETISILVRQNQIYDGDLKKQFLDALDRKGALIQKDNDTKLNKKLRDKLQVEVKNELPTNHFYIPRSDISDRSKSTSSRTRAATTP
jgi:hypothetical protein